jgi:hypothetical protein
LGVRPPFGDGISTRLGSARGRGEREGESLREGEGEKAKREKEEERDRENVMESKLALNRGESASDRAMHYTINIGLTVRFRT